MAVLVLVSVLSILGTVYGQLSPTNPDCPIASPDLLPVYSQPASCNTSDDMILYDKSMTGRNVWISRRTQFGLGSNTPWSKISMKTYTCLTNTSSVTSPTPAVFSTIQWTYQYIYGTDRTQCKPGMTGQWLNFPAHGANRDYFVCMKGVLTTTSPPLFWDYGNSRGRGYVLPMVPDNNAYTVTFYVSTSTVNSNGDQWTVLSPASTTGIPIQNFFPGCFPKDICTRYNGELIRTQVHITGLRTTDAVVFDCSYAYAATAPQHTVLSPMQFTSYTQKKNMAIDYSLALMPQGIAYDWTASRRWSGQSAHMYPIYAGKAAGNFMITGKAYIGHMIQYMLYAQTAVCHPYTTVLGRYCPVSQPCCLTKGLEAWFVDNGMAGLVVAELALRDGNFATSVDKDMADLKAFVIKQRELLFDNVTAGHYHSVSVNGTPFLSSDVINIESVGNLMDGLTKSRTPTEIMSQKYANITAWYGYITAAGYLRYDENGAFMADSHLAESTSYTPYAVATLVGVYGYLNRTQPSLVTSSHAYQLYKLARSVCPAEFTRNGAWGAPCDLVQMGQCISCERAPVEVAYQLQGYSESYRAGYMLKLPFGYISPTARGGPPPDLPAGYFGINMPKRPVGLCVFSKSTVLNVYGGVRCLAIDNISQGSVAIPKDLVSVISADFTATGYMVISSIALSCNDTCSSVTSYLAGGVSATLIPYNCSGYCEPMRSFDGTPISAGISIKPIGLPENTQGGYSISVFGAANAGNNQSYSPMFGAFLIKGEPGDTFPAHRNRRSLTTVIDSAPWAGVDFVVYSPTYPVCAAPLPSTVTPPAPAFKPAVVKHKNVLYKAEPDMYLVDDLKVVKLTLNVSQQCTLNTTAKALDCVALACGNDTICARFLAPYCVSTQPLVRQLLEEQSKLSLRYEHYVSTYQRLAESVSVTYTGTDSTVASTTRTKRAIGVLAGIFISTAISLVVSAIGFGLLGDAVVKLQTALDITNAKIDALITAVQNDLNAINNRLDLISNQLASFSQSVVSQFQLINQNLQQLNQQTIKQAFAVQFVDSFTNMLIASIGSVRDTNTFFNGAASNLVACVKSLQEGNLGPACVDPEMLSDTLGAVFPLAKTNPILAGRLPLVSNFGFTPDGIEVWLMLPLGEPNLIYSEVPKPIAGNKEIATTSNRWLKVDPRNGQQTTACVKCAHVYCFTNTSYDCDAGEIFSAAPSGGNMSGLQVPYNQYIPLGTLYDPDTKTTNLAYLQADHTTNQLVFTWATGAQLGNISVPFLPQPVLTTVAPVIQTNRPTEAPLNLTMLVQTIEKLDPLALSNLTAIMEDYNNQLAKISKVTNPFASFGNIFGFLSGLSNMGVLAITAAVAVGVSLILSGMVSYVISRFVLGGMGMRGGGGGGGRAYPDTKYTPLSQLSW
uniref:Membrane protein ORF67 n=1 Tax=Anguillid herpesvirus 1 TaxID=150286 RepID=A0A8E5AIX0_9VIRU|nr:membrane protein ORF67 [Anguillid herpesvirus 1]